MTFVKLGVWIVTILVVHCLWLDQVGRTSTAQESAVEAADTDGSVPLETLLKRLSSNSAHQRQLASREIYNKGPGALKQLKSIKPSGSAEFNQRVADLIAVLEGGDEAVDSQETRDVLRQFPLVEFETRQLLLGELIKLEKFNNFFRLLRQLSEDQIQEVFRERQLRNLIPALCRRGRWEDIRFILSQAEMWRHETHLCAFYHATMGTLDGQVDRIRREVDQASAPTDEAIVRLIQLLLFQKKYDVALRYARRLDSPSYRNYYVLKVLTTGGDWKTLARQIAVYDGGKFNQDTISATPLAYGLAKYYGGTKKEFEDAIQWLKEKEKNDELEEYQFSKESLGDLYLMVMDWESARKYVEFDENELDVRLLKFLNRNDEIFDRYGIGKTYHARQKWANNFIDRIVKSAQPTSRTRRSRRRDRDDVLDRIESSKSFFVEICTQLSELGLQEEAVLYLRQLVEKTKSIPELRSLKIEMAGEIAKYDAPQLAWEYVRDANFTSKEMASVLAGEDAASVAAADGFFAAKQATAMFVYEALTEAVPDATARFAHTCLIINYGIDDQITINQKRVFPDGFDLDAAIAAFDYEYSLNSSFELSNIYAYHNRPESRQWLETAASQRDSKAMTRLADEAFLAQDYAVAAKLFEQIHQETYDSLPLAMAGDAYGKLGNLRRSRQLKFHAFVLPSILYGESGQRLGEIYRSYLFDEFSNRIPDRAHLFLDHGRLSLIINQSNSYAVLSAMSTALEKRYPQEAMNSWRMRTFNFSSRLPSGLYYALLGSGEGVATMMAKIDAGDFDGALADMKRINQFSPGSPSVVEESVRLLDKAGQTAIGDQVTQLIADSSVGVLAQFPNSASLRNNYAWALARARRMPQIALRHAQAAVRLQPTAAGFLDTLAEAHFVNGDYDQAVGTIDRALQIEPQRVYFMDQRKRYLQAKQQVLKLRNSPASEEGR